ncbi:hypothetical protein AB0O82_38710 [Kitasatospora sp. NPDC088264]|uniref:hypothetical protein n=1 Tax=Kitasatospora sp. NPDC088264 TaxID=3155296 RepID=UPI003438F01A
MTVPSSRISAVRALLAGDRTPAGERASAQAQLERMQARYGTLDKLFRELESSPRWASCGGWPRLG